MVSVEEALRIIMAHKMDLPVEEVPLTEAVGRVLAEPVTADRDFPPFDRVMMDGIAVVHNQLTGNGQEFLIEETQAAGQPQKSLKDIANAIEVMTGAILPEGTDTVIRYEDVEIKGDKAILKATGYKEGANVHPRGKDAREGDELLSPGDKISPAEVALIASVGKSRIKVYAFPKTAVISTGDELVDVSVTPELHQIRQSNSYALQAAMRVMGWEASTFYLTDNEATVNETLRILLAENDILIISGGVSKGKFDFVPEALQALGVKKLFHKVTQRPGKPFWFGAVDKKKIVFALPGNPVSTYLCFFKYIRPWMLANSGTEIFTYSAVLEEDFVFDQDLTYFLQVQIKSGNGVWSAVPRPGGGSGDFANLKNVDGFLELSPGQKPFKKGQAFPYIPFRP